jgi:hypothetical protein
MNSLMHTSTAVPAHAVARSASDRFRPFLALSSTGALPNGDVSIRGGYAQHTICPNLDTFGITGGAFWNHAATTVKCHSQRRRRF